MYVELFEFFLNGAEFGEFPEFIEKSLKQELGLV